MLGEEGGRIRTVPPQVAEGGAETCVFIHPCQLYWSVRAVRMFRAPGPCFQAIPRHPRGQFLLFFMQGLGLDVLSGCLEMWTRISGGTMDGGLTDRSAQVQDQAAAEHLSRETCQCHVLSGR